MSGELKSTGGVDPVLRARAEEADMPLGHAARARRLVWQVPWLKARRAKLAFTG